MNSDPFTPSALLTVPVSVDLSSDPLDQRIQLWKLSASLAPTSEWAEFGVSSGRSTRNLLQLLPGEGRLHCFDSERGLPEAWDRGTDTRAAGSYRGHFSTGDRRVVKHVGWFKDTLPKWKPNALGFVHIDCDIYSSTVEALAGCTDFVDDGTVIMFDELYGYPTYAANEWLACSEWLVKTSFSIDWIGRGVYQAVGIIRCSRL